MARLRSPRAKDIGVSLIVPRPLPKRRIIPVEDMEDLDEPQDMQDRDGESTNIGVIAPVDPEDTGINQEFDDGLGDDGGGGGGDFDSEDDLDDSDDSDIRPDVGSIRDLVPDMGFGKSEEKQTFPTVFNFRDSEGTLKQVDLRGAGEITILEDVSIEEVEQPQMVTQPQEVPIRTIQIETIPEQSRFKLGDRFSLKKDKDVVRTDRADFGV